MRRFGVREAPLTVYGSGSQTRSFCYVDDLIEGLVRLGTVRDGEGGPINLGNTREVSVAEIARLIIEITGSSGTVEYLPLPQDDPMRRCPDTTRARAVLSWEANTPLEDGLPKTVEYFRDLISGRDMPGRALGDIHPPDSHP